MKATKDSIMLQFWFPKEEFYTYLQPMIGYSEFCRNAIIKEIQLVNNDQYANDQIQYHQNKIKEWKEKKKAKPINEDKIQELLAYHAPAFKKNAEVRSETQRLRFIEKSILPTLKKLGYQGSPQKIDETLLNWPEENK